MMDAEPGLPDPDNRDLIEGTARVVALDGGVAWLEPEQTTACAGCHSAAVCGVKPGSARLMARRFSMPNRHDFRVGERIVVGIPEDTLRRASLTVYGIPLLLMLAAGITVQKLGGGDLEAAAATLAGLAAGLLVVRQRSRQLSRRGELAPRYLRRAFGPDAGCGLDCSEGP